MKDFPVFTTENGVGSLILKEIPYTGKAYIKIQDSKAPLSFLDDCASFCKAVGAAQIYAAGHPALEKYPFYTAVWQMTAAKSSLPDTDAALFPVTEDTLPQWVSIHNEKMMNIPNAAYMSSASAKEMLSRGDGYFIHRKENLLGIGIAADDRLTIVASVVPGAGRDCVLALCHALHGEIVTLEVASENRRAIRLYERLHFLKTAERSRWYTIF